MVEENDGREFLLLKEPWIKVSTAALEQKQVSLIEVMTHAQDYIGLSGETPTQDAAMLRLLLAIVLTVFYRYDENGREEELSEENDCEAEDVLERWKAYWDRGSFPEEAVKKYLEKYSERFWLFHPQTPFFQVNGLYEKEYGTEYPAKCLVGNIKESGNPKTKHHFSMADGEEIEKLDYAEAARWLVHLNAYGVNVKAPGEDVPGTKDPVGVGRLGQLGLVMLRGENLFRALMLNLCPLKGETDLWKAPNPAWEREVCIERGNRIAPPDNLPELYTMQSRRVTLKREAKAVTGFRVMGGDFYPVADDFNEPMTLWQKKEQKGAPTIPKVHDASVYAWQEFPALLNRGENEERIPGIVEWLKIILEQKILTPQKLILFQMIGMVYGDKMKYTYGDCVCDSLGVSEGMLTDFAKEWIIDITKEVDKCKEVAEKALGLYAKNLNKLFYGDGAKKSNLKDTLVRNFYFSIDKAFRAWLAEIDPLQEEREEKLTEWREQSYRCARQTVEEYLSTRNMKLYAYKEDGKNILTIPQALNQYLKDLRKIYPK